MVRLIGSNAAVDSLGFTSTDMFSVASNFANIDFDSIFIHRSSQPFFSLYKYYTEVFLKSQALFQISFTNEINDLYLQ